jgi:cellulose synthase/poly-beta-1,6-N-acetylglucosamine synthase-like glycosyltransferase
LGIESQPCWQCIPTKGKNMDFNALATSLAASLATGLVTGLAALLAIPACCLLLLTLAAGARRPAAAASRATSTAAVRVAILVPAHNESVHVLPTLRCLQSQLQMGDRLLVIADNCSDDTAAQARGAGAEVLERQHATLRGKGYALAFGVDALRAAAPDVIIVVDADCSVSEGAIRALAQRCQETQCPVQLLDLMLAPPGAGLRTRILEFAWLVKNQVRPLGSFRLGRACHLMGTGMALPWNLAANARLATGHITEDMKLGVDLAIAGRPTQFLAEAQVTSEFPRDAAVARTQKARWEHGHLQTLTQELPRLLAAFVRRPRAATLVLAMDLVIPPLALYFVCLAISVPLCLVGYWFYPAFGAAAVLSVLSALALALAIALAWLRHARHVLSLRELLGVPLYAAWKLPVYVAYFLQRKSGWTRTARKV